MKTKVKWRDLTIDEQIDEALRRAKTYVDRRPKAVAVEYRAGEDVVALTLATDTQIIIPRRNLQGLESASPRDLASVEILGSGLRWESLDVDHYIPSLVEGVYGNRRWMSEIGAKGGAVRSEAKTAAARANGKKGGRPKRESKSA